MAEIKGIVTADTLNVRADYKTDAPKAGEVKKGQELRITGFAVDPKGDDFKLRYRIVLNGKTLWTTAKFVSVDPALVKQIPFIAQNPANAAEELLEASGMDVKDGTQIAFEEAQAVAALMRDFKVSGTFDDQGIRLLRGVIEHLHACGVTLGSDDSGSWSMGDLQKVQQAVDGMAGGMGKLFEQLYGARDDAKAFRTMYAPLHITRSGKNNVSPWPEKETWFAKNSNGYEIVLGNRVFFEGTTVTRSNPHMPYSSVELIAHEIGHVINWRYSLKMPKGQVVRPREFYESHLMAKKYVLPTGESVSLSMNDGYLLAARSSNGPHETVTDAITAFSLDRLTENDANPAKQKQGQARRLQIADMLGRIIQFRVESYTNVEGIRAAILKMGGAALETTMQTGLELLKRADSDLDKEMDRLKKTPIKAG
ncbi:MAG: SH3 domain-containing protein [Chloroflexi bacterium]|nr:SH3 domain-containing protein [Chloroflexota bacterium]